MYHVIIKTDKRTEPRKAIAITTDAEQLHSMGESIADITDPNLIYVAEWDMKSESLNVLKGDSTVINMCFAGWPVMAAFV